jgi:hypothetical protein
MITNLEKSPVIYKITMNEESKNTYSHNENTVAWDPTLALKTGDGGIMTPAGALAHELGHADQDNRGDYNKYSDRTRTPSERLAMEESNVKNTETPIQKGLNGGIRSDYSDWQYAFRTDGATTTNEKSKIVTNKSWRPR